MTDIQRTADRVPASPFAAKLPVVEAAVASWRVFRQRPWPFIGLALLPGVAVLFVTPLAALLGEQAIAKVVIVVAAILQYAVQFACQNAGIYGGERLASGTSFAFGEAISVGFRRLLPVLVVVVLASIIVVIGLVLLVIPGLIAGVALAPAVAVSVVERRGPIETIKRSFALTKGNRWRIVGVFLIGLILPLFAVIALVFILAAVLAAFKLSYLVFVLFLPMFLIFGAIGPVMIAVVFVELRALKDGVGPRAAVAGVFD